MTKKQRCQQDLPADQQWLNFKDGKMHIQGMDGVYGFIAIPFV